MIKTHTNIDISDFDAVRLSIASPEEVLKWSHGEVTKPETINYRTQKPERDGLFCERIFGPTKDINPNDAKYKGVRSREAAVDKNGELVTRSIVRRERMGHIALAAPVAHIWFLRGTPSAMSQILGMTVKSLERIAYFASYIITKIDAEKIETVIKDEEIEYTNKKVEITERFKSQHEALGESPKKAQLNELAKGQTKELEALETEHAMFVEHSSVLALNSLISESDYREMDSRLKDCVKVGMGGQVLKTMLDNINLNELITELRLDAENSKGMKRKKTMKRLRLLEGMQKAGIKPNSMCIMNLPVIPPDLRPMVQLTGGRFATSDLNDLYRRVINRNNRLKKLLELNAPEVIKRNEMRMLQEAVDALIDNSATRGNKAVNATSQRRKLKSLSDMLKGKQGRFRQNLLGKRVDYSGRSVIVAGPELKMHQCGLPKMMALELFKPFVIGWLIDREIANNIRMATRLIELNDVAVWDALDFVIKGKYVLLNRAPSLHRLSVQAFQPVLIEGKAIQLHPLVCKGFNADFDGDQMAVHLPLSDEAQEEARTIMAANLNLLKPADGTPILHIEQDIVLGCYYLTYQPKVDNTIKHHFGDVGEAIQARDNFALKLQDTIEIIFRGEKRVTTLGRVIFNEIFPEDFPFVNETMTKKKLSTAMSIAYSMYGQEKTAELADELKNVGFDFATRSAISLGMDDFTLVEGLDKIIDGGNDKTTKISEQFENGLITEAERYRLTVQNWLDIDQIVQDTLTEQFTKTSNSMSIAVESGARGNIGQVKTAVGMLGVVTDASGRAIELPIKNNYKVGLTPLEYFTATRGARKGMIDTALKTADSGYLTRRLVDVAQDVFTVDTESEDPGFSIYRSDSEEIGLPFSTRLAGRFAAENIGSYVKKDELITNQEAQAVDADESITSAKIRSILSVKSVHGIPLKSYGVDLATGELVKAFTPVGVIAAQSIGEPGTQLTLRTFHAGGVAKEDITTGLPRVEELFEARNPKGESIITKISGIVEVVEDQGRKVVMVASTSQDRLEFKLGDRTPKVQNKSQIQIGDVLADDEEGKNPLISPIAGVVSVHKNTIIITPKKQQIIKYEIPSLKEVIVNSGDTVNAGDKLTSGSMNLQDLMLFKGIEDTQRYVMNEILKIFVAQGQNIADKHLEIIVRQMFSRVQVEDPGDSEYVTGDIVSRQAVMTRNTELEVEGKKLCEVNDLLLGLTKASLATDSFLSAASFQDTTRVLITAATSGKVDHLYGLKENVILGRKIPVGTGQRKKVVVDDLMIDSEE